MEVRRAKMLQRLEIQGIHAKVDDKLKAYVIKKLGGLDRYISRHGRESAHLPHQTIIVKENALNMYAAVDIVEAKLKQAIQKYKDLHTNGKTHRHLFARFRRKSV
jgi:ribosome-associated translation inhibitor RaiA